MKTAHSFNCEKECERGFHSAPNERKMRKGNNSDHAGRRKERLRRRRGNAGFFAVIRVFLTVLPRAVTGAIEGGFSALRSHRASTGIMVALALGPLAVLPGLVSAQCQSPCNLEATASGTTITLNWDGGASYKIQWTTSTGETLASWPGVGVNVIERPQDTGTQTPSYTHENLMENTRYWYRITDCNPSDPTFVQCGPFPAVTVSTDVDVATATTEGPPPDPLSNPENFTATTGADGVVDLAWDAVTDVSFKIQWNIVGPADTETWTDIPADLQDGPTYSHVGLTAETTYYYRIRAESKSGSTDTPSDWVKDNAVAGGSNQEQLLDPTNFTATPTGDGILLAWDVVTDVSFKIQWNTVGPADTENWTDIPAVLQDGPTYLHEDLRPGTTYYYRIRAEEKVDVEEIESGWAEADAMTASAQINLEAVAVSDTEITVSWNNLGQGRAAKIQWHEGPLPSSWPPSDNTNQRSISEGGTTEAFASLTADTEYWFRIGSCVTDANGRPDRNSCGNLDYPADQVTAASDDHIATAMTESQETMPPTNLEATATGTTITLTWTGQNSHKIQWVTGSSPDWASVSEITVAQGVDTYPHTGLMENTQHWYRITGCNPSDSTFLQCEPFPTETDASHTQIATATTTTGDITLPPPLPDPTGFDAATGADGIIDLTWDLQTDVTFEIQWNITAEDGPWDGTPAIPNLMGDSHSHTGLTSGGTYYYRIRAKSKTGEPDNTPTSEWVKAEGEAGYIPVQQLPQPTGFVATPVADGIDLTWNAQTDVSFEIQWNLIGTGPDRTWLDIPDPLQTGTTYSHTDLMVGTTYYYRISAKSKEGASDQLPSEPAYAQAKVGDSPDKVSTPMSFRAKKVLGELTSLELEWDKDVVVEDYVLERADTKGGTFTDLEFDYVSGDHGVKVSYTDKDLEEDKTYYYQLIAIVDGKENSDPATTEGAPGEAASIDPVLGFSAVGIAGGIKLTWDEYEGSGSQLGIQVNDISADPSEEEWEPISPEEDATSYTHTEVTPGETYWYRIRASTSSVSHSEWSDVESAIPKEGEAVLDKVTGLDAEKITGKLEILVSWNRYRNKEADELELQSKRDGGGFRNTATLKLSDDEWTHEDLKANSTYTYRIRAVSDDEESEWSNEVSVDLDLDVPSAPKDLEADESGGDVVLTWKKPEKDGGDEITGYVVEHSTDGAKTWSELKTVGAVLTYTHEDPPVGTNHYRVRAKNENGQGAASNTANVKTEQALPSAPRSLRGSATDEGNRLQWTAPENSGSSDIRGYRVEVSRGSTGFEIAAEIGDRTTWLHENAEAGQSYRYRVYATNQKGTGPASNTVTVATKAVVPYPPRNLTARALDRTVNLSWSAPSNDGGASIEGYRVEYDRFGSWALLVANTGTATTSYRHTDVQPGSRLSYRVFAINSAGRSEASNIAFAEVKPAVPKAPKGVAAITISSSEISLAWNQPENTGGSPLTAYRIEFSDNSQFWQTLEANFVPTSTVYRHRGLKPAQKYFYRIFAINRAGRSKASDVVSATTRADLPGPPEDLRASSIEATRIELAWNPPENNGGAPVTGYRIETSSDAVGWNVLVDDTESKVGVYRHEGLEPVSIHYYRVRAINEEGMSEPGRFVRVVTDPALPDKPTALTAMAQSHEEITLAWSVPEYDGGAPITGYRIEFSIDDGDSWRVAHENTGSTVTGYKHSDLVKATVYLYRVAAVNRMGPGERSATAEAKTHALAPTQPRSLSAEGIGSSRIDLRWRAPEDDGGAPITSYQIDSSSDGEEWEYLSEVADVLEYSHMDVEPGQKGYYRVWATNEAGTSPASNVASATTDDPVQRSERVIEAILPRFASASVSSSIRSIATRVDAVSRGKEDGQQVNLRGGRGGTLRSIANGSSMSQSANGLSIWGNADLTGMREDGVVEWRGDVFSVHAGLDGMLREGFLVGLAGSKSSGMFDFTDQTGDRDIEGEYEANLTSMNPYVAWIREDLSIWATAGIGWGMMTVKDFAAERSSNMSTSVLAVGGSRTVHSGPIGGFVVKAEGWSATVDVDGNVSAHEKKAVRADQINESSFQMRRARAQLDWIVFDATHEGNRTEVRLQGGVRHDWNGFDTGVGGAEFGGEARLAGPTFRALADARMFVARDSDYREWGVRAMVELRSRDKQGLAVRMDPSYGSVGSGIDRLWENGSADHERTSAGMRLNTVVEYSSTAFSGTPYGRVDMLDGGTHLYSGMKFTMSEQLDLRTELTRRDQETGLSLRGFWRF